MIIIRLKVGPFSFEKCTADKHLLLLFDGKEILEKKNVLVFLFFKKKMEITNGPIRERVTAASPAVGQFFFPPSLRQFDRTKKEIVE